MIRFLHKGGDYVIARLSENVSSFFIKHKIIAEEDREIYDYSFEVLFSTLISTTAVIVVADLPPVFGPGLVLVCD